jgi:hypothetical protein
VYASGGGNLLVIPANFRSNLGRVRVGVRPSRESYIFFGSGSGGNTLESGKPDGFRARAVFTHPLARIRQKRLPEPD